MAKHKNKVVVAHTADTQSHAATTPTTNNRECERHKLLLILLHLQALSVHPTVARMALIHLHISIRCLTDVYKLRNSWVACRWRQEPQTTFVISVIIIIIAAVITLTTSSRQMLVLLFPQRCIRSSLTLPHNWLWGDASHTVRFVAS